MDWSGLLQWSLQFSDGTRPSEARELDEETKKWLTEALSSMCINETELLKRATEALSTAERGTDDERALKLSVLHELQDAIESLETARNFVKIGGMPHLVKAMIGSTYTEVRHVCCQIFASAVQNNPQVQKAAIDANAYQGLALRLQAETQPALKGLYVSCFSSLLRGEASYGRQALIANNGMELISEVLLNTDAMRVTKKLVLLLSDLFFNEKVAGQNEILEAARERGLLPQAHLDEPVDVEVNTGFIDGIGGPTVLREMWPLVRNSLDGVLTVSIDEAAAAVRLLAERNHVIAEGAGAVPVAAT